MFFSQTLKLLFVASIAGSASAFAPIAVPRTPTVLLSSQVEKGFTADSGMNVDNIPLYIDNLNVDNFQESLEMFEALLTNECVGDVCDTYVHELEEKAQSIGMKLPKGFAGSHH